MRTSPLISSIALALLSLTIYTSARAQEVEPGATKDEVLKVYAGKQVVWSKIEQGDSVLHRADVKDVALWGVKGEASMIFNAKEKLLGFSFHNAPEGRDSIKENYSAIMKDLRKRFGNESTNDGAYVEWTDKPLFVSIYMWKSSPVLNFVKDVRHIYSPAIKAATDEHTGNE